MAVWAHSQGKCWVIVDRNVVIAGASGTGDGVGSHRALYGDDGSGVVGESSDSSTSLACVDHGKGDSVVCESKGGQEGKKIRGSHFEYGFCLRVMKCCRLEIEAGMPFRGCGEIL